jgi:hypothetical protein
MKSPVPQHGQDEPGNPGNYRRLVFGRSLHGCSGLLAVLLRNKNSFFMAHSQRLLPFSFHPHPRNNPTHPAYPAHP